MESLINPTLKEALTFFSEYGDSIHSLVLKFGHFWMPGDLPENVQAGRLGECFRQARELALLRPECFTYVEGFAYSRRDLHVAVHHAWCVDQYGNVVDPTWIQPSLGVYAGVPFKKEVLRKTTRDQLEKVIQWGYLGTPAFFKRLLTVPADLFKPKDSYHWADLPAG